MMNKLVRKVFLGAGVVLMVFSISCGPKMASQKTLSQLEECQAAYESAQKKVQELEQQISQLENKIPVLERQLADLEAERDSLRGVLNILEQGY